MASGAQSADPASWGEPVTPSNTVNLTRPARGIWVGSDGDVAVLLTDLTTILTFKGAKSGTIIPVVAMRVMVTGTSALNLVALN